MDAFLDPALKNREYRADLVPRLPGWCRPEVVGLSRDERGEQQGGCDLPKPWNKRVTVQHV
jgi:hypothetical protein